MSESNNRGSAIVSGGWVASLGEKVVRALPPAFLVLVLLNIGFIGMALWVFSHNTDVRNALLTRIVDACLLDRKSDPP